MNVFDGKTLMAEVRKASFKFSRWENKFLRDIEGQLGKGYKLSDKQSKCLQKVYRKVYAAA